MNKFYLKILTFISFSLLLCDNDSIQKLNDEKKRIEQEIKKKILRLKR